MALLLLAFALLGTLLGAPRANAAPSVDTWVRPTPPRAYPGSPFYYDVNSRRLRVLELGSNRRLWSLPDTGQRTWEVVDFPLSIYARSGKELAYDEANDRVFMMDSQAPDTCCGPGTHFTTVLWQFSMGATPGGARIPVGGPVPYARNDATLAYDPRRQRVYMVGGRASGDSLEDQIVALDLAGKPAWSVVDYPGPRFRCANAEAIVDTTTDRLLVIGGERNASERSEVWALPLAGGQPWENWSPPDSLPILNGSDVRTTALDPVRRRLLRFSGVYRSVQIDTAGFWSFDLVTHAGWTPISPPGAQPLGQRGASIAVDPVTGRVFLMGGEGYDRYGFSYQRFDLFELPPGGAWSPLALSGEIEPTTEGGASAFDEAAQTIVYFTARGYTRRVVVGNANYQDWEYQDNFDAPRSRQFAAMAFDGPGNRSFLFGGRIDTAELNDLWQLTFPTPRGLWTRMYPDGELPTARWGTASVFDPVRRRWILFGGFGGRPLNETWALTLNGTPRWQRIETHGPLPSPRFLATGVYDSKRDGMLVFGGSGEDAQHPVPMKDTWFLSFADGDTWQPVEAAGQTPLARYEHAALYDPRRDRMLVFYGRDAGGARFDCASLELGGTPTWKEYIPEGPASATRFGFQAYYLSALDRGALMGGGTVYRPYADATQPDWYLDFAPATGGPEPPGRPLAFLSMGPNPTNAGVDVAFDLPASTVVRVRIYDARGRLVRAFGDRAYPAGRHLVHWDGAGEDGYRPRPGVYFARLALGAREFTGKIVLLRN